MIAKLWILLPLLLLPAAAVPAPDAPVADVTATGQSAVAPATPEPGGADLLPGRDAITDTATQVLDVNALASVDALIDQLADRRLVFIGETHDRYEDHLNQLAIIRGLHARGRPLIIGMEFFQQPFQPALDAYIAGTIGEAELLRQTEYFERWRFDYRLYRPILRFARAEGIPVVALNVPAELVDRVSAEGLAAVAATEPVPTGLPAEVDRDAAGYREHLRGIYDQHPQREGADFERFLDVQLLWDEGMAERAAAVLAAHPDHTLVVLAGVGHVEYDRGIPQRVLRRVAVPSATVLNGNGRNPHPALADFILYPQPVALPATGLLGVMLDTGSAGAGIAVNGFAAVSGAKDAGVKVGDRIVRVGGTAIDDYTDIRIALMDAPPGARLPVEIERKALLGGSERLTFDVELR